MGYNFMRETSVKSPTEAKYANVPFTFAQLGLIQVGIVQVLHLDTGWSHPLPALFLGLTWLRFQESLVEPNI